MILRGARLLCTWNHVCGLFLFHRKKGAEESEKPTEPVDTSLLCKFVLDGAGKKLGESVSIDHDVLIIKSGSQFLGVPLKHVESSGKTLVVRGLFDVTKAYELGEKWRRDSYREMNKHDSPKEKAP